MDSILNFLIFLLFIWLVFEFVKDYYNKNISPNLKKAGEKVKDTFKQQTKDSFVRDENGDFVIDPEKKESLKDLYNKNKNVIIPVLVFLGIILFPLLIQLISVLFPVIIIGFIFREPLIKLFKEIINKDL